MSALVTAALFCAAARTAHAQEAGTASGPETGIERLNPLSGFDPASLDAFRDRPLFAPTRRPPPEAVVSEEPVQMEEPASLNMRLLGVVKTPEGFVARIADLDTGTNHSLRANDMFLEWTVEEIGPSSVVMRQDEQTLAFTLFSNVPSSAPPSDTEPQESPASDATQTPRAVRIIEPAGRSRKEPVPAPQRPRTTPQDIIDFFGPNAQTAE